MNPFPERVALVLGMLYSVIWGLEKKPHFFRSCFKPITDKLQSLRLHKKTIVLEPKKTRLLSQKNLLLVDSSARKCSGLANSGHCSIVIEGNWLIEEKVLLDHEGEPVPNELEVFFSEL